MADNILRLQVDSQEYDSKIKRAAEGIQQYAQKCREVGGTLEHLDDGVLEFVNALGQMDTVANGTKGQLRELTNALTDITLTYRSLTDEEKASPFGQALAANIDILTERAGNAKDAMADVAASIQNASSDTRSFDQMAQGMSVAMAGFQGLTGAGKLLGIEMGNDVEIIAKLQAAMAVTNSLTTIQTALQKQSALMQGVQAAKTSLQIVAQQAYAVATGEATVAQAAFNAVAAINPYVLLATAAAAAAVAIYSFTDSSDEAAEAQKQLNRELENTKNQLSQIDKDTDFSISIAEAAGKSWKEIHELRLEAARTKLQLADMNYDKLIGSGNASADQLKEAAKMQKDAWDNVMKVLNEGTIHDVKMRNSKNNEKTNQHTNTTTYRTSRQSKPTALEGSIDYQTQRVQELTKAWRAATNEQDRANLRGKLDAANKVLDEMTGKVKAVNSEMVKGTSGFNEQNISNWTAMMKSELAKADFGSERYNNISASMSGMSILTTTVQDAIKMGLQIPQDAVEQMFETIFDGGSLPEDMYHDMIQKFVKDFKEQKGGELTVGDNGSLSENTDSDKQNKEDKKEQKQEKSISEGIGQLSNGMQQMVGSMQQLGFDIPAGLSDVLGGIQTVVSVLTAISTIVSAIEAISAADALIPFANGGIVPHAAGGFYVGGTHTSGDVTPILANAGELVLNRSQQGVLADALSSGAMQNLRLETAISGRDMKIVLNNDSESRGKGKFVTSNNIG